MKRSSSKPSDTKTITSTNNKRGQSLLKNDLIFVGIPFLLTQIFLFRKQILVYTVGEAGASSSSTATTAGGIDLDMPQYPTTSVHGGLHEQQQQYLDHQSYWQPKQPQRQRQSNRKPDAIFNGFPLYYHEATPTTTRPQAKPQGSNSSNDDSDSDSDNIMGDYYYSTVHCIGETYNEQRLQSHTSKGKENKEIWKRMKDWSWMHRSCHFQFLCLDIDEQEYVIFQDQDLLKDHHHHYNFQNSNKNDDGAREGSSRHDVIISSLLQERPFIDITQSGISTVSPNLTTKVHDNRYEYGISLGSINLKWNEYGAMKLKWFPKIRTEPPQNFYTLPSDVIMIPFHSMAAANPGHLVWDDFLPIYTILHMFQMIPSTTTGSSNMTTSDGVIEPNENPNLLLLRYSLPEWPGLWASCDWLEKRRIECQQMHDKFGPLLLRNPETRVLNHRNATNRLFQTSPTKKSSNLICAKHAVAGIGSLTDHGTRKIHGWDPRDYSITHNLGRGGLLWNFRNFMMTNLGISTTEDQLHNHKRPYKIIFSKQSSARVIDFTNEITILRQKLDPKVAVVEEYRFRDYTLKEQAELMNSASILVTGCGGGSVTGIFLPRGASILIYYNPQGGLSAGRRSGTPARLDWDLFNNLSYLKVHWMPQDTMNVDRTELVTFIEHELRVLQREEMEHNSQ